MILARAGLRRHGLGLKAISNAGSGFSQIVYQFSSGLGEQRSPSMA